jgi:hypothetical protein
MKNKLSLWEKLIGSFDNTTDGFSARKLSAFIAVVVAIVATFRFADEKVIIHTLIVWLVFALMCLGIITAEQILKFYKRGDAAPQQPEAPAQAEVSETNVNVNVTEQKQ